MAPTLMTAAGRRAAGTAQAWRRRQAAGARVRGRARGAEGWHRTASKVTSPSTCLKPRRASSGASASSGARSSRFAITETSVHGARPARHSRLSAATTCAAPPHSRGQRARRAGGTGGARGGGGVHTKVLRVSRGLLVAKRNSAGSPAASPPAGRPCQRSCTSGICLMGCRERTYPPCVCTSCGAERCQALAPRRRDPARDAGARSWARMGLAGAALPLSGTRLTPRRELQRLPATAIGEELP
jgi:hypothetical protein